MGTMIRLMILAILMAVALPVSGSAVQIFECEQDDGVTDEQIDEIMSKWMKAAREVPGGEKMDVYLHFPIAASVGETDFTAFLVLPSFEDWGKFTDGYSDSAAEDVDDELEELTDCAESSMWESMKVE